LGAAFLCSEAGISPPVIENQAAYLAGWLKARKDDRRAIVVAAAQAEKAVDLILGHSRDHSEEDARSPVLVLSALPERLPEA
jgi:antirestriction protein ArdC